MLRNYLLSFLLGVFFFALVCYSPWLMPIGAIMGITLLYIGAMYMAKKLKWQKVQTDGQKGHGRIMQKS